MSAKQPKQKTQPKGIDPETGKPYEPVQVPVPKRGEFDALISKAANPAKKSKTKDSE